MSHPLIPELAAQQIQLFTLAGELRYRCPDGAMTPAIKSAIAEQKIAIIAALEAEAAEYRHHSNRPADGAEPGTPPWPARRAAQWPDRETASLADFCLLLTPGDLPSAPFPFGGPWRVVVNAAKFLHSLQSAVRLGSKGPKGRTGALAADLRQLRAMLMERHGPVTERPAEPAGQREAAKATVDAFF